MFVNKEAFAWKTFFQFSDLIPHTSVEVLSAGFAFQFLAAPYSVGEEEIKLMGIAHKTH